MPSGLYNTKETWLSNYVYYTISQTSIRNIKGTSNPHKGLAQWSSREGRTGKPQLPSSAGKVQQQPGVFPA